MSLVYIFLTIAIANLTLGFLVFSRNRKSSVNITFFLMTLFVSLWIVFNYLIDVASGADTSMAFIKIANFSGVWAGYFFLYFAYTFPSKHKKSKLMNWLVIVPILLTVTIFSDYVIVGAEKSSWGYNPVLGPLGLLFFIIFLMPLLAGLYFLISNNFKSRGLAKLQSRYVVLGFSITIILVAFFSVIMPLISKEANLASFSPVATIFFVGFTSYAIVKHRLMDIRLVVARSITYAILLATLALFYAGSVLAIEWLFFTDSFDQINLTQGAIRTILAVIMAFSFQPLRRWITRKTDRIFFKNAYDPQKLLDDLSHLLSSTIVLEDLLAKVLETLTSEMKISRGIFILFKEDYSLYATQKSGYKKEPKLEIKDALKLARNGTAVYDELDEASQYKEPLRKLEAAISLPLKTEKEIVGVLLLGEKNSGDMFNQQDLRILEILAPEVSVAVENAKSYEEISRFNITLRNEVKRATRRLEEKNAQLRELDQAKDEFISMASHQLRTPLTVIKGYLSMLLEGDVGKITKDQEDFVHEAYDGSNRMVRLINDLLNVSRMDTGRFFIEPTEVDIEALVNQEVKNMQKQADEKGLYLKVTKSHDLPHVWVDETKIRQVVMNFIDNAVFYTEQGGITVSLKKEKEMIVYSVQDTGVGIPKKEQAKIFEKFFRATNARKIRPDGTGLGIYLAKRVIEDHGGDIFFESVEGKGSTFGFKLPFRHQPLPKKGQILPELPPIETDSK